MQKVYFWYTDFLKVTVLLFIMVVFSVCKDLCPSFSNDMQGMFLYVQKR